MSVPQRHWIVDWSEIENHALGLVRVRFYDPDDPEHIAAETLDLCGLRPEEIRELVGGNSPLTYTWVKICARMAERGHLQEMKALRDI